MLDCQSPEKANLQGTDVQKRKNAISRDLVGPLMQLLGLIYNSGISHRQLDFVLKYPFFHLT